MKKIFLLLCCPALGAFSSLFAAEFHTVFTSGYVGVAGLSVNRVQTTLNSEGTYTEVGTAQGGHFVAPTGFLYAKFKELNGNVDMPDTTTPVVKYFQANDVATGGYTLSNSNPPVKTSGLLAKVWSITATRAPVNNGNDIDQNYTVTYVLRVTNLPVPYTP